MSDSVVSITHRDSAVIIDFLPSAVNPRTYVRLLSGSAPGQRLERYPWIPVAKYLAVADTYPRIAIQVNVSQRGDLVMGEAMVQVPRRLIEELLRYVEAQPEPAVVVDERQGVWTESMVNEFREEIRRRYAAVRPALPTALGTSISSSVLPRAQGRSSTGGCLLD
jgi:hypothetical protein